MYLIYLFQIYRARIYVKSFTVYVPGSTFVVNLNFNMYQFISPGSYTFVVPAASITVDILIVAGGGGGGSGGYACGL